MAGNITDAVALSKTLGNIYTEVFQKKPSNPNAPINRTHHIREDFSIEHVHREQLITQSSVTCIWGNSTTVGFSDQIQSASQATRWSFTGFYS